MTFGAIRGSIHVPFTKDRRTIGNTIAKAKVDGWIYKVRAKIAKKGTLLVVHDQDGKYAVDCLDRLFNDGYKSIVGLKGGFQNWDETFQSKLTMKEGPKVMAMKSLIG